MNNRSKCSHSWMSAAFAGAIVLAAVAPLAAQVKPEQAARMVLDSAHRAYNEKNYSFAADRFREFLGKYGNHKEANAARYGLALCLIEGPKKDYNGAIQQLQPLAGDKNLPEHPFVLYYLGLSQRGLGTQALAQALAKPAEANQQRNTAQQRFEEASKQFAAAVTAFTARIPKTDTPPKETPIELEWAARRAAIRPKCCCVCTKPRKRKPSRRRSCATSRFVRAAIGVSACTITVSPASFSKTTSPPVAR